MEETVNAIGEYPEMKITEEVHGPIHNWECGYCDYSDHCPVKYVKEK